MLFSQKTADYADENDEYSDTVPGNELVYDDEEKDGEGEVYSRSAPQDYDDYEEGKPFLLQGAHLVSIIVSNR